MDDEMQRQDTAPQTDATPAPRASRWKFGRGVYESKDVPIRALNIFIVCLIAAILILTVVGAINGGFQVSFDTGLSDVRVENQKIRNGGAVEMPETPVRPGYTLVCWSTDAQQQLPWSFANGTVSSDMTLYAVWAPAEYTVHFDADGGKGADGTVPQPVTVTYGETYGTLPTVQKEGSVFAGWNCNGVMVTAETEVSAVGDQVLTAVWQ